ncbi:MAG: AgmX/PglI C-terminal domain-containing protein [Polyangiaceae bacterium]
MSGRLLVLVIPFAFACGRAPERQESRTPRAAVEVPPPEASDAAPAQEDVAASAPAPERCSAEEACDSSPEPTDLVQPIQTIRPAVKSCYDTLAKGQPGLSLSLTVRLVIDPSGTLKTFEASSSPTVDGSFHSCVARAFRRARFPKSDEDVTVSIPFRFVP